MKTTSKLSPEWKEVQDVHGYKVVEYLGEGTYGSVVKAMHIQTEKLCAIKLVQNCFRDKYCALQISREIKLLRKLTEMKDNIFTTHVIDIILPVNAQTF